MRSSIIIDFLLIFANAFFTERGNERAIAYVAKIRALKEAGAAVDDHMQTIADAMGDGAVEMPWDELQGRINDEVDRLAVGYVPDPEDPPGSGGGGSGGGGTPPSGDGTVGDDHEP